MKSMEPVKVFLTRGSRTATLLGVILSVLLLAGCIDTQVRVRLEADGSGTRHVEISWKEGALKNHELTEEDLRVLLELSPDNGWTMRHEDRTNQGGKTEPYVIFERDTELASIDEWGVKATDLVIGVSPERPERVRDEISVETGRGSDYRTISYLERLDGAEVRWVLDRLVARYFVDELWGRRPEMSETTIAELRGLLVGHLSHVDFWDLEDEEMYEAWDMLVRDVSQQFARVIEGRALSSEDVEFMRGVLHEILENDEVTGPLHEEFPGLRLLGIIDLKFELAIPGTIIESNADRIGNGLVAWKRTVWSAISHPIEFRVAARIED